MRLPLSRDALSREVLSYENSVWSGADVHFDGVVI